MGESAQGSASAGSPQELNADHRAQCDRHTSLHGFESKQNEPETKRTKTEERKNETHLDRARQREGGREGGGESEQQQQQQRSERSSGQQ